MFIQSFRSWQALTLKAVILSCLIGCGINTPSFTAFAQTSKISIKLTPTLKSPLKLSGLKVEDREIKFDEEFEAGAEWVKNVKFKLENISDKRIVFVQIHVHFPEPRSTGYIRGFAFWFGQRPELTLTTISNEKILLSPNETLNASLEQNKEGLPKFVKERESIEPIQKVELEIRIVIFDDKTRWKAGVFQQPDPNDPTRWISIKTDSQQ